MYEVAPMISHRDFKVPNFVYGTAWKESQTQALVTQALQAGFKGIDTACQRKHYHEAGVGEALKSAQIDRSQLFIQSKYTFQPGQDHRLPYDPQAPIATQVQQSFETSLKQLHTDYLDSYILHGPMYREGLSELDWEAWRAMEQLCQSGQTRMIGVSNVSASQLKLLVEGAKIPPAFVQNRCYARTKWDVHVRDLCLAHDMLYQGFSLLTANVQHLNGPLVVQMMQKYQRSVPQLVFRFAMQLGMQPLTGTTSEKHMKEDLAVYDFELAPEDMETLENIGI